MAADIGERGHFCHVQANFVYGLLILGVVIPRKSLARGELLVVLETESTESRPSLQVRDNENREAGDCHSRHL